MVNHAYATKTLAYVHYTIQHKESYDDDDVMLTNAQNNTTLVNAVFVKNRTKQQIQKQDNTMARFTDLGKIGGFVTSRKLLCLQGVGKQAIIDDILTARHGTHDCVMIEIDFPFTVGIFT